MECSALAELKVCLKADTPRYAGVFGFSRANDPAKGGTLQQFSATNNYGSSLKELLKNGKNVDESSMNLDSPLTLTLSPPGRGLR